MKCQFYATVGLCKYGQSCQRSHMIVLHPTNFIILPNIAPFTQDSRLNELLLQQTVQEVIDFAVQFDEIKDFVIATNNNHLYGTMYLQFYVKEAAEQFKLSFPQFFGGNRVEARFLDIQSFGQILCQNKQCNSYFCQKVHERYFRLKDIKKIK